MGSDERAGREIVVDVRQQLLLGKEPFSDIMAAAQRCQVGDTLVLYATFKPVPLLLLLKRYGFESAATKIGRRDWRVDFHRVRAGKKDGGPPTPPMPVPGADVEAPKTRAGAAEAPTAAEGPAAAETMAIAEDRGLAEAPAIAEQTGGPAESNKAGASAVLDGAGRDIHLDNRGLEPPQPMVRTLEAVYELPPGGRVVGKFDRKPMFLLPKLEEMGYRYEVTPEEDGRATVTIWRRSK